MAHVQRDCGIIGEVKYHRNSRNPQPTCEAKPGFKSKKLEVTQIWIFGREINSTFLKAVSHSCAIDFKIGAIDNKGGPCLLNQGR
jgi:hypothetical protein